MSYFLLSVCKVTLLQNNLVYIIVSDVPVKGSTTVLMVAKNTTLTEENGLNITEHDSTIIVTSLDSQEHTTELFLNDKHNKSAYIINKNVTSEPSSISPNPPTTQQSDTSKATSHAQTSAGVTMSSQITSTYPIITSDAHTSSELIGKIIITQSSVQPVPTRHRRHECIKMRPALPANTKT